MGMICCVKPVLTEDLCVMQKEEFSITCQDELIGGKPPVVKEL
jgi:hypothetical protein